MYFQMYYALPHFGKDALIGVHLKGLCDKFYLSQIVNQQNISYKSVFKKYREMNFLYILNMDMHMKSSLNFCPSAVFVQKFCHINVNH